MGFYLIFTYSLLFLLILVSNSCKKKVSLNTGRATTFYEDFAFKHKNSVYQLFWFFLFLLLVLVLGLRGVKTGDYDSYGFLFSEINSGSSIVHPEKSNFLFNWICRVVYIFGGTVNSAFLVCSVITISFFFLGLRYSGADRFLFVALFLLSFQYYDLFNIVRQGMTDAIAFYVICKMMYNKEHHLNDNFVAHILLLVASALLHSTGWLFLGVYIFLNIVYARIYKKPVLIIELIIMISISAISYYLANNDFLSSILSRFFGSTWRPGKYNVAMQIGIREIGEGVLGIIVWMIYRIKGKTNRDWMLGFLVWLFVVARFMTPNFRIMFRIADCFMPFFLVALIRLPRFFKDHNIKTVILACVILFYAVFFFFKIKGYGSYHEFELIGIEELFR